MFHCLRRLAIFTYCVLVGQDKKFGTFMHRRKLLWAGIFERRHKVAASVADPDPGSGAFLTPGYGIRKRFFPDPGSQNHTFESLGTIFWVKSFIIL
jgi:hypothetical protein